MSRWVRLASWVVPPVLMAGVYTIFGGLAAVIYTELLQAIVLLGGAITLTLIGLSEAGGMSGLRASLPPDFFHMIKPMSDPNFPWTGIFFGAPILGIWYWCTDQVIVQRVLGPRLLRLVPGTTVRLQSFNPHVTLLRVEQEPGEQAAHRLDAIGHVAPGHHHRRAQP